MFWFTQELSSGGRSQCLVKITGMVPLCQLTCAMVAYAAIALATHISTSSVEPYLDKKVIVTGTKFSFFFFCLFSQKVFSNTNILDAYSSNFTVLRQLFGSSYPLTMNLCNCFIAKKKKHLEVFISPSPNRLINI